MSGLSFDANIAQPDDWYELLTESFRDLSQTDCLRLSARLIFLLANHIGDEAALREALAVARGAVT